MEKCRDNVSLSLVLLVEPQWLLVFLVVEELS